MLLAAARREFGPVARAGEESRAAWQYPWIQDLVRDLRYGLRSFRHSPGFALTAILSLALGMGAHTAIFQVLYTVLWKPLSVKPPRTLVAVSIQSASAPAIRACRIDALAALRHA